jgi:predicted nucleotide-binding protein
MKPKESDDMPFKVYFSDTSDELDKLRPVLIEQIQKAGMTPVWLDEAEKQATGIVDIVQRKIADSDAFISIVTYKRGWEPEQGKGQSLAEIEYDVAESAHKPIAVLLPKDPSPMGMYLRMRALGQPPPDQAAQRRFWERVQKSGMVVYFEDEADLTKQVAHTLQKWASESAAPAPPRRAEETFLPTSGDQLDAWADRIALKTAEKVQTLQQQQQEALAEQALKYNEALRLKPGELVFGTPSENRQFHADVFMIMPFAQELSGIYQTVIMPLVKELKLMIVRGDDFTSSRGVIMEEVWSALNQCRFVIVDITGGNDNVFYELGIAHTLNKPAILITQAKTPDEVPFDIRHLRFIQYINTAEGTAKLSADLKTAITRLLADLEEGWGNQKG